MRVGSIYCLNSSVSSFMREVITRSSALSCSIRVFSRYRIPPGVTKGGVGRDAGRNGLRET